MTQWDKGFLVEVSRSVSVQLGYLSDQAQPVHPLGRSFYVDLAQQVSLCLRGTRVASLQEVAAVVDRATADYVSGRDRLEFFRSRMGYAHQQLRERAEAMGLLDS